jgi:hypothetical protein
VALSAAKDVEDAVKDAYQKYVKEERPRNKALSAAQLAGRAAHVDQDQAAGGGGGGGGGGPGKKGRRLSDVLDEEYDGAGGLGSDGGGLASAADASELALALQEAYAQRDTAERTKQELAEKLEETKLRAAAAERNKLAENSALMGECNELRSENVTLKRSVDRLRQVVRAFEAEDRQKRDAQKLAAIASRPATPQQQPPPPLLGGGGGKRLPNQQAPGGGLPGLPGPWTEGSLHSQETDPFGQIGSGALGPPQPVPPTPLLTAAAWGGAGAAGDRARSADSRGALPQQSGHRLPPKQAAAAARAGRAEVLQQNAELAAALDENERVAAVQRQELGALRALLGGGLARQGGGGSGSSAHHPHATLQSSLRDQRPASAGNARARGAQLRAKKPGAGPPGGGELGLFPADDARNAPTGAPFMSKAATLQGRQ